MHNPALPGFAKAKHKPDFEIQTIGSAEDTVYEPKTSGSKPETSLQKSKAHMHDWYEIIWVTSGSVQIQTDLTDHEICTNQLFFIPPGRAHQLDIGEEVKGYVIRFNESFFDLDDQRADPTYFRFLFQLFSQSKPIAAGSLSDELENTFQKMLGEFQSSYTYRNELLKRYFKIFLIYLTRHLEERFTEVKQTRNIELVNQFIYLIDKKFKSQKMVAAYAGELAVSPNYLNEVTKKLTGYSAGHHIRRRIILEAKRLGRYSDHCMKEIAWHLGFSDSAHFSKFFKTESGTNFTEFKNQKVVFAPVE